MIEEKLKIYECAKDGLPDVGRPFIAFRKTHEDNWLKYKKDRESINKLQGICIIDYYVVIKYKSIK